MEKKTYDAAFKKEAFRPVKEQGGKGGHRGWKARSTCNEASIIIAHNSALPPEDSQDPALRILNACKTP